MNRAFQSPRAVSGSNLGPLETRFLEALWRRGDATVRELLVDAPAGMAYTTAMTTLDRLYKKGILDRVAEGRAFRYSPRHTQAEIQRAAAGEAIHRLFDSAGASSLPLSYLVAIVSERDRELLDDLQLLVERKRRQLEKLELDRSESDGQEKG